MKAPDYNNKLGGQCGARAACDATSVVSKFPGTLDSQRRAPAHSPLPGISTALRIVHTHCATVYGHLLTAACAAVTAAKSTSHAHQIPCNVRWNYALIC